MKPDEIARRIFPYLVETAKAKTITTYGALARKLEVDLGRKVHAMVIGDGLGYIRDGVCRRRPMLNALCVNKLRGMPGESWDRDDVRWPAYKRFEETVHWLEEIQAVWKYKGWDRLLEKSRSAKRRK
jgi:hypothetical protein